MSGTYRILHLIKGLGRGGAERLLSEGLRYADLTKFHYQYAYFLPWKDALVSELQARGSTVTCFRCRHPAGMIFSTARLVKFLEKSKIDLVHCHLPWAGIVGRLAAKTARIPIVYTEHNVMERYHPWTRWANLRTWKWQTSVVAVSNEVAASIDSHTTSAVPVHVIQNGVAIDTFTRSAEQRSAVRRQFSIPADAQVVGTVAALRLQKNLADWIRAAQYIKNRLPNTHFLLVGDGPLRSNLENQVNSFGLKDSVHFTGLQENVVPFYSAMDVFMSSSLFEGLPLALLEAMAMLLPVVATNVGGTPEVIRDGSTGFLVQPGAPNLLAEKAILLLMNPHLRQEFGIEGRRIVEQRFSIGRMVAELERLYLEILERPSRRTARHGTERISKSSNSAIVH